MIRVGRAQWRSHGATGEARNGRSHLIKKLMPSSRPCSINRSSRTHRKPRHRPAHQPAHLPQVGKSSWDWPIQLCMVGLRGGAPFRSKCTTPRTGVVALRPPRDPACMWLSEITAAESHKPTSVYHLSHRSTDMYSQIYVYIAKCLYLAKKMWCGTCTEPTSHESRTL